jgi:F420-non-reducing hydrogenase iron-sulfur subunit
VNYAKELLDQIGLGGERLEMYFLSAAEGARFAEIATEMTERIRELGPNPLRNMEAKL